jgi:BirA family transcriptional regulator, biotin operon repressor / biotin---[acetyl-CoA-carboxylase] ligase
MPLLFDVPRILHETSVCRVEYHAELASTNDFALQELQREGGGDLPLLVLVDRQTQGRGRTDRSWWSSEGALTFSLALPIDPAELPHRQRPLLALATGLAVCDAIGELVPASIVRLKWPNDVYLAGRKICGILIESPARPADVVVVGIGVNVNNSLIAAPPPLHERATSIRDVIGGEFDLTQVLVCILRQLEEQFQLLTQRPGTTVQRYRHHCLLTGKQVTLNAGLRRVRGHCTGIDDQGRLVLQTESGTERFLSGSIEER